MTHQNLSNHSSHHSPSQNRLQGQATPTTLEGLPEFFWQICLGTIFFVLICLSATDSIKQTTLYVLLATLGLGVLQQNTLVPRFSLPMIPLLGWVSLSGISIFYALAKKFALQEFLGLLLPFCILLLLVLCCKHTQRIAAVIVIGTTWMSFLSIDLLSTRIFSNGFEWFISFFTQAYGNLSGVEVGVRMTSILRNPNVYAGCAGIAVLLSLGLARQKEEEDKRLKNLYLTCLFLNSLGFVLAFSLGATATLILGFLVYLLWEEKEKKLPLFILMVETLILSVAAAFPIFLTSFTTWESVNWVPVGCTLFGAGILIILDATLGKTMTAYFKIRTKQSLLFFASILSILALYALVAVTYTNDYTLSPGESLKRSSYPEAGEYTLTLDSTESTDLLSITIQSQTREQTMMHTNTVIYRGNGTDISFTVPENSEVIHVYFSTSEETTLHAATLSNGKKLDLNYPLLPGFIVNRLQGLLANQNAIQRTVFFEDGMKLFTLNPLFGLGMGSFENALFTVQSFYYETDYVHNHYIQMLLETGILGLCFFITTLVTFFLGLWKARKHQGPQVASSLAVLVFVSAHATVELVWSTSFYLMIAYGSFAVMFSQIQSLSSLKTSADNPFEKNTLSTATEQPYIEDFSNTHDNTQEEAQTPPEDNFKVSTEIPSAPKTPDPLPETMHNSETQVLVEDLDEDYIEILEEGDPLSELSFQEAPPQLAPQSPKIEIPTEIEKEQGDDLEIHPWKQQAVPLVLFSATVLLMSLFSVLLYGNIKARELVLSSAGEDFLPAVVQATKMDVFETQDYWVTYLDSIHEDEDPAVHLVAEEYIAKLEQISSNSIPMFIARYYLSQNKIPEAVDALVDYVSYVISKSEFWNLAYRNLLVHYSLETAEDIINGLARLENIRATWNEENMGTITLDEDVQQILDLLQEELS